MDDEGTFTPPNPIMFGNIDYDFMDQLLGEGCWLQTADGSGILHPGQVQGQVLSSSRYPPYPLPSSEAPSSSLTSAPPPNEGSHERERCGSSQDRTSQDCSKLAIKSPIQPLDCCWEGDELNRIMWIGPRANSGGSTSVQERLMMAISNLREMNRNRDVLIQLWIPIKKGLKSFLTTVKQPHFFQPTSTRLLHFRDVSELYEFPTDEHTKQALGLPGRVFLGKAPEWTPNVCFFKQEEYPRVKYAHVLDVRASIALPVFERGSGDCLGVVEVIMTTEKINYRPELESICKALESVNLRSSEMLTISGEQGAKRSSETILADILNVLRTVCDTHQLPLAQTWAPCFEQGKVGCWNSDKNGLCVSTIDSACYVRDERVLDFHRACSDHHLLKGHGGIVGKAFETNQPCFAIDVTEFSKGDYPLSHHAKMFGLRAALAVRLHSIYHKSSDYVLEFYLPSDFPEKGLSLHDTIWQSLSMAIHQHCRSLQFITVTDKGDTKQQHISFPWFSQPQPQPQRKGKEVALSLDFGQRGEATNTKGFKFNWSNSVSETDLQLGQAFSSSENNNIKQELSSEHIDNVGSRRSSEKRRTKAQKTISLQVLRQYFAGSLKDAAKSIGVCPTTLKRICRQHGISRWPSRKIKKVDHSLRKLQMVIDSVQGAQGSIKLSSFYTNFPELNNNNNSNTRTQPRVDQFSSLNLNDQPKNNNQPTTQPEGSMLGSGATTSSSPSTSSTHTSTSSHCFSSGPKTSDEPHLHLHLQSSTKKQANQLLETSQSNTTHTEHPFHDIAFTLPLPITTKSCRSRQVGAFKAKASFAEEKIRFTILPNMGFRDLQQEIIKRFHLEDLTNICIKYLDDDREWVLLTCDDDLDECIDIHKSSGNHSIKLTLSPISSIGGSVGSRDLT